MQQLPTAELTPRSLQWPLLTPDLASHFPPLLLQPAGFLGVFQTLQAHVTSGPLPLLVPQPEMLFHIRKAHSLTLFRSLLEYPTTVLSKTSLSLPRLIFIGSS